MRQPAGNISELQFKQEQAAASEARIEAAQARGLQLPETSSFEALPGFGAEALPPGSTPAPSSPLPAPSPLRLAISGSCSSWRPATGDPASGQAARKGLSGSLPRAPAPGPAAGSSRPSANERLANDPHPDR